MREELKTDSCPCGSILPDAAKYSPISNFKRRTKKTKAATRTPMTTIKMTTTLTKTATEISPLLHSFLEQLNKPLFIQLFVDLWRHVLPL